MSAGGCSGHPYGMAMKATTRDDVIRIMAQDDVQVVIDPQSCAHISRAMIDTIDDTMGGGFSIENPDAVSTCGCGNSLKTEPDESTDAPRSHASDGCNC